MNAPQLFPSLGTGLFGRRLKRERGARIPVTVVTGFLGAGKTTLIRNLLTTPEGQGTAVVVNEYGAVSIDDALLRDSADETVLLGNGCLCCTVRSDLQLALRKLAADRERGEIPDFRRVVIETSGLADPGPILQTFATDRALGDAFYVEVLATLVDAAAGAQTLDWSAEARKQAILADRLIVTKTDIAATALTAALKSRLQALNPRAAISEAKQGVVAPDVLLEGDGTPRNVFIAEASHSDGIASFVLTDNTPLQWAGFARAMDTLIALRGADLLRVKGFLDVEGCAGPLLVQFVQHLAHPPVELTAWPPLERASKLVFITRNLRHEQVEALFAAVRGL